MLSVNCGSSSVGRAAAFQAACREFEPRLPLHFETLLYLSHNHNMVGFKQALDFCSYSSVVEHSLGKGEVSSSNLDKSSIKDNQVRSVIEKQVFKPAF